MKSGLVELSEDDVREACIQYATENCCYGTKFARDSEIKVAYNTNFYYYQIETFTEKREIRTKSEPYRGQPIDWPENGPSSDLWDIKVELPALFKNDERRVEVPHSARILECLKCTAIGHTTCELCNGMCWRKCVYCSDGKKDVTECGMCSGSGRNRCWSCNETGRVKCRVCDGGGILKQFKELTVTWSTYQDSFATNAGRLPRHLILKTTGKEVFREQNQLVSAITHCDNEAINDASRRLIVKHEGFSYFETIKMQRHSLRAIPITKSTYSWKNKSGKFYVYGFEKKVFFPAYPQKCCICTCL